GVRAVNRTRGGEYEVLHSVVRAAFKNVCEAHQIRLSIKVRVGERVANPGLGSHMDHAIKAFSLKQAGHPIPVLKPQFEKAETGAPLELCEACPFQVHIVVVAEVVEADYRASLRQQASGYVKPDKSSASGYQDFFHYLKPFVLSP